MPETALEKELEMIDDEYEEETETETDDGNEVEEEAKTTDSDAKSEESDEESTKDSDRGSDDEETKGKDDDEETESQKADSSAKTSETSEDAGKEGDEGTTESDEASRIDKLLAEINRLNGLIEPSVVKDAETETKTETDVKTKTDSVDSKDVLVDFVGDLDMDDVASDSAILNQILNKVMKHGIEVGKELNKGYSASDLSQVVATQVSQFSQNQIMIDQFYKDNSDLVNVKQVVKACATQIASESPDKGLEDILKIAAVNTRKTLGIGTPSAKTNSNNPNDAAFASQKGGQRKKAKKLSKLQQELDEL